jgi:hypothetical protein
LMYLLTWFASKWLACWAWLVTCINYVIWIGVEISLAWFRWIVLLVGRWLNIGASFTICLTSLSVAHEIRSHSMRHWIVSWFPF